MDLFDSEEIGEENEFEPDNAMAAPPSEEFLHPRHSSFFTGHEEIEKELLELYNQGRLPHGLIFAGPSGIGKATMAYRLARFLFKQGAYDHSQDSLFAVAGTFIPHSLDINANETVFSRVASGGHSDLLTIERLYDEGKDKFRNTVETDEVRKIAPFFRMTASEGGWRIVIIDDADTMNLNAQNALLKILEEPPKNALLILVTHRAGALLPTIRSRSRMINFQSLPSDTMKTLLQRHGQVLSQSEVEMLLMLSRGSFGRAVKILESDGLKMTGRILDLLEKFPVPDWMAIHKFSDSLALSDKNFELFSDIALSLFEQLVRARARKREPAGFGVHMPLINRILSSLSLEQLLSISDALASHLRKVETGNLDKRQGILTAFSLIF